MDHSVIRYDPEAPWILVLAHVLVGEPDSTSPGHALVDGIAYDSKVRAVRGIVKQRYEPIA
jgi:hypothetical protein